MGYETEVIFLGTSGCVPDIGNDTSSMIVNRKYLFDTGWSVIANLRQIGIEPAGISHLFFTHLHHDHYLSLPSMLFYYLCKSKPLNQLKIIGPQLDVERVVRLAYDYLQVDRFYTNAGYPTIIPLNPGDSYRDDAVEFTTCSTLHPVQGLCYRMTDHRTGKVVSITGDTACHPPLVEHVRSSHLLIHEASLGPVSAESEKNKQYLHSGAKDAGRVAMEADVDKLFLVHGTVAKAEECVAAAAKYFNKEIVWPETGFRYVL